MAHIIFWNGFASNVPERTLGVYQLAGWLRSHGYKVKVLDFCNWIKNPTKLAELTRKHITEDTVAIGVSTTFWSNEDDKSKNSIEPDWVHETRKLLEWDTPKIQWILGGSRSHKKSFKDHWVRFHDYAEDALLKWMDERCKNSHSRKNYDIVDHCSYSFEKEDAIAPHEVLPLELSRGCRFECSFCRFPLLGKTPGTYIRTEHSIREELIRNYNEFGTTNYNIMCDTYNESPEKVQMVHDIVQSLPFEINFAAYIRADLMHARPEQIRLLKDSGLRSAFFGIESFHPKASMAVGKGWNGKKGKDFLLKLKDEWGERTTWQMGFIVGLPGDTPDSLEETYEWCIANEMKCWDFNPLGLSIAHDEEIKSKFERESEKYGYTMTGPVTWKNDVWTSESAIDFANMLNKKSIPHMSPGGFQVSKFISMGYSYDYTLHAKYGERWDAWPDIAAKRREFIINYIKQQEK